MWNILHMQNIIQEINSKCPDLSTDVQYSAFAELEEGRTETVCLPLHRAVNSMTFFFYTWSPLYLKPGEPSPLGSEDLTRIEWEVTQAAFQAEILSVQFVLSSYTKMPLKNSQDICEIQY